MSITKVTVKGQLSLFTFHCLRLRSESSCSPEMITFFSELSCSFINTIGLSIDHCIKNNPNLIVPFCFNQEYLPDA